MTGPIHEIGSAIPPRAAEVEPLAPCSVIHAGGSADHAMDDRSTVKAVGIARMADAMRAEWLRRSSDHPRDFFEAMAEIAFRVGPSTVVNDDETVGDVFAWVAMRSDPSVATAWTCGLSATALCWMLRLIRRSPVIMSGVVKGAGHMWVEMDGQYYDPTIGQFGDYRGVGPLPHPVADEQGSRP